MKNQKVFILFFILLMGSLFLSNDALAAWTQAKGHSYNQLTYSYYRSTDKYTTLNSSGGVIERVPQAVYRSTDVTYYGEYGIIDKLTVFTAIPYKNPKSDDTIKYSGENGPSGIGNIDLGLRYNLSPNLFGTGVLMSLQGAIIIPEAYDYGHPLTHLSLGDGQYDTQVDLLFGRGFGKAYGLLNIGYRYRFENTQYDPDNFKPSDQVKVFIGGGYGLPYNLELRASVDYTKSVGNASVSEELRVKNYGYGGAPEDGDTLLIKDSLGLEPDVLNLGFGLAYTIPKQILKGTWQTVFTYNIDVGGIDIIRTKDAGQGATYSFALVYMH